MVSMEGEETGSIYVQIPEKEMEEEDSQQQEVLTEEEKLEKKLLDFIAKYNSQKSDPDYYYLPSSWNGKNLEWKTPYYNTGNLLAAMTMAAAFAIIVMTAREEQSARAKRYEELMMDYPGLTDEIYPAGTGRYDSQKCIPQNDGGLYNGQRNEKRAAYEELVTACNEMESGISEMELYAESLPQKRRGHVKSIKPLQRF